ncbi:MAG: SPOR domain-containing protein [Desulfomonilaceae bacterium]
MQALGKLQKTFWGKRSAKNARNELCPSEKPKNGLLALGVLVTIAIMVGLTLFNLRLMREQVTSGKQSIQPSNSKKVSTVVPEHNTSNQKQDDKLLQGTTEVTFYKQLKSEDNFKYQNENLAHKPKSCDTENKTSAKDYNEQSSKTAGEETDFSVPALTGKSSNSNPENIPTSPKIGAESKTYSIQVGVFSYPKVAQEWADKLRSKGYPVILRPIAKPNAGIQYRLLVGEFNSEKKAEEFVRRLKTKEGITGVALVRKH